MTARSHPPIEIASRTFGSWRIQLSRDALDPVALAQGYDRAAHRWDDVLRRIGSAGAYRTLIAKALTDLTCRERLSLLDVGTGTGALTLAASRVVDVPLQVTACDLSRKMRSRAAAAFERAGLAARIEEGDVTRLRMPDASFDLTMAAHVLEHLPRPEQGLREMVRVTRPGGRVLICLTRPGWAGRAIQLRWRTNLIRPATMLAMMADAGLSHPRILTVPGHRRFNILSYACVGNVPTFQKNA